MTDLVAGSFVTLRGANQHATWLDYTADGAAALTLVDEAQGGPGGVTVEKLGIDYHGSASKPETIGVWSKPCERSNGRLGL